MKPILLFILMLVSLEFVRAQSPPPLYIHIVSHNEPTDNLDAPPGINYSKAKTNLMQMANLVNAKNVKWNLQTSDGMVIGALQFDSAGTSPNDLFETLAKPPYNDNIEIDPRPKNKNGRNIADQWYLLDSIGANPTKTVGGFLWYICQPSSLQPDWWPYEDTLTGLIYGNKVKFNLLSGAGSAGATLHCNDLNDFGIFKPDTVTNFYHHNPARNLWCIGTGCAPVLDSMDNADSIIALIKHQVDSIQLGYWPPNKFYVTRIMTNQREYGPLFFTKLTKVIDSLNVISPSKLKWATLTEMFSAFQTWQTSSGLDYSQWLCGQTVSETQNQELSTAYRITPNPFTDRLYVSFMDRQTHHMVVTDALGHAIYQNYSRSYVSIDLSPYPSGLYMVHLDNKVEKVMKW